MNAALPSAVRITCLPAPMPAAAAIYSLIESAKLNGLNPQAYLADVLARIADHPARRIAEILLLELAARRHHPRCRLIWPAHRVLTMRSMAWGLNRSQARDL
jgi:hypothetical protein